jgi:hypothetical protein
MPSLAPHGVRLPPRRCPHLVDGDAFGPAQQRDHLGLLRGARRLRIGESLQRRPHAIDQRLTISDLAQSVGTGQTVPQGEQPLATEPCGAQFKISFSPGCIGASRLTTRSLALMM